MNIDVDKIVVSLDVVAHDAVVVEVSAVAPSGIVTEAVAKLPTQVVVISHEETPTVTPLQIIDYSNSSIECAFDVTSEQAEEVVKGVLCGTINPPTFENADYRLLHGQGSMDLAFAGLQNNTEYYLRPYALSNLGYKYGDVVAQRTKASPIPSEYQLVEYLESSGAQYINTLLLMNTIRYCLTDMQFTQTISPTSNTGCGCQGNSFWYRHGVQHDTNKLTVHWGPGGNNVEFGYFDFQRHVFVSDVTNAQCSIDGVIKSMPFSLSNVLHWCLFLPQGALERKCSMRIFQAMITTDIEHNLYPVYRKSDRKPGMYDIINNVFYINQGTGEFTVGPDKEWEE